VTVPVEDLRAVDVDEAFETLERAVADHVEGEHANVAVVSDPFGGREALLDYAEQLLQGAAERVRLTAEVSGTTEPDLPDAEAMILDDCQHLYRREIGGFDALDRVLEEMAMSDRLYVTSWNRYAWEYLKRVRDVDRTFPVVITVPELDAAGVERLVTARFGPDLPEFVDTGEAGRIKTLDVERHDVGLPGGRTASVPVPKPNTAWATGWWTLGGDDSIEAVVYEKVRRVSNGNPGIATSVWEEAVATGEDGAIAPAYVRDIDPEFDLDDEQAFLLLQVVAGESVRPEALTGVAGDVPVDQSLQTLASRGVVTVEDGRVSITPGGLAPAVEALRRRRLVW